LLAGIDHSRPKLLLDQRRQVRRPALSYATDVEPLRQLHL
jgi:hypothetical protein